MGNITDFISNAVKYHQNNKRIKKLKAKGAKIGKNVFICKGSQFDNPQKLIIGDNVYIGYNFYSNCRGGLTIGKGTLISYNCTIITYNHDYKEDLFMPYGLSNDDREVIIKERVCIGINVNITAGVVIGNEAIIGMGTTVAKKIPDGSIYAGGRFLSEREPKNYKYDLLEVRAVYHPLHYLKFKKIMKKIIKTSTDKKVHFEKIKEKYNDYDTYIMIYRWCENNNYTVDWKNEMIQK